ncbi:MAG: T9SS type A sorting domain-containing protein [Bacteroidetes bacterium]|nr:T9SS type A sorting domain-containing protein [Bacteroidota bacterium]
MFTITGGSTQSVVSSPSVGTLTITDGGWTNTSSITCPFGINGDQILIYQTGPTFIFGFNNGNNTTGLTNGWNTGGSSGTNNYCEIPPGLTNGSNAIGFGGAAHIDNMMYNGTRTGTKATLLAAISNSSNWISDDLVEYDFSIGGTNFSGSNPIFNLTSSTTWNGTTWSNGTPTAATDAIIASSVTPGSFTCKALTINSGVALTMNSGATANINGNLTNSGNGFSGTGTFNFAASSTLSGNAISCAGTVTVASGATLTTAGLLTFTSDATNTGRIGNSAGTISGIVNTQRYIPGGRRAFRFLAHPFNAAQSMNALTDDIDITGSGGSPFTTTGSNNPSAFYFDVAAGDNTTTGNNPGWTAFTASSTWAQYQAMRVLVRGAKGEGLTSGAYTPSAATIDMSGSVNQGNQTINLTKGSGTNFVLVGNPFQSQINMDAVSGTNIGSSFYIWNANQGTRGAYTSYTFGSSSFNLPAGGAFVTTLSASGSVVIEEADKTNNTPGTMLKTTGIANQVELKLEDSTIFWDRLLLNFDDNAMATVDYPDAAKLYNPDMTFYTLSKDDSMLSIDTRPYVASEVIKLGLHAGIKKDFKFTAPNVNMPAGTKLYFTDKLLSKTIEVTPAFEYWFTVDTSNASWGNNRFELNTQGVPTSSIANVNASKLKVKLVPNPATDNVTIYYEGAGKELNIVVTNMMGVKVASVKAENVNGNVTIPTAQLASGIYNVTIYNGSEVMTQKLIKQ